jgi:GntR family transcriptional repressor for pyruvate dehydrogenase complex
VRDGFRILEVIGLIEMRHGQGTFARELSVDRLVTPLASVLTYQRDLQEELLDVRRMFEPAVARVAATRVMDSDLAELRRVLESQRKKLKKGQSTIVEDTAFHAAMARATRNRVVVRIMETLNDLLVESRKMTLQQTSRPQRSLEGHEAIVAALAKRDPEAAANAMRQHVEQIAGIFHDAERDQPRDR